MSSLRHARNCFVASSVLPQFQVDSWLSMRFLSSSHLRTAAFVSQHQHRQKTSRDNRFDTFSAVFWLQQSALFFILILILCRINHDNHKFEISSWQTEVPEKGKNSPVHCAWRPWLPCIFIQLQDLTWNVRTLHEPGALSCVVQKMEHMGIDLLGISETHWPDAGDFRTQSLKSQANYRVI
ncbi:craniofacial development protein 2 [Elysia marginata]|uniref:Craniofacial development protein 2 n=1 Tax=Elysia marginata TaxID=1093978 RepID=A0AAV4JWB5_9GAST|nr:craniofacial development protein 2 [Elysia marginata]